MTGPDTAAEAAPRAAAGRKKILFVSQDATLTEAQLALYDILRLLDRQRYEAIVTLHKDGPFARLVEDLGWRVVQLKRIRLAKRDRPPLRGLGERLTWWLWKRTRGTPVVNLILKENIDLVHTTSMICFEGAYGAQKTGRPHIWHIREVLPGNRRLFGVFGTRRTLKMIARYSTCVVSVTDAVRRQFTGWQRQPDKYLTLPSGVDTERFDPAAVTMPTPGLRTTYSIDAGVTLLGYVGPVSSQAGFWDLLDACILMHQEGQTFALVVASPPPSREARQQVQKIMSQTGITGRIHFTGVVSNEGLPVFLKQLDIYVSPGAHLPFDPNILAAMAMSVPVVATNGGGAPEMIQHDKSGLLAKPGVPGSLANKLKLLLADTELRLRLGQTGRQQVLESFTLTQAQAHLEGLYEQLLTR